MKIIILCSFLLLGASNCSVKRVALDPEMSALAAEAYTGLIEGCGNQPIAGYTYCEKVEDSPAYDIIYFLAPPADCEAESCVSFKVFKPNGEVAFGDSFKKGEKRKGYKWSLLTGKDTFQLGDRGWWGYVYTINFVGTDGRSYVTKTQGEIRMRVSRKEYIPLTEVQNDPNFVWSWTDKVDIKMTAGGRTYIGELGGNL